jgi:flagellar biosynthesis GTPase FlhF
LRKSFNLTETEDGKTRAIQPQELYRSQQYGTAVYQVELAWRLRALGYEIEPGKNHAPEIKGYTKGYLEESSPRSQQIKAHLEEHGLEGAGAAQIAAHRTRDAKAPLGAEEILARHRKLAAQHGNQADRIVAEARERAERQEVNRNEATISRAHAREGMTWARDRHMEREAVADERELVRDALRRSMGQATFESVRENFNHRIRSGEFIEVGQGRPGAAERSFTTRQMLELERENIALMKAGQERFFDPMVLEYTIERMEEKFAHLTGSQRKAVEEILAGQDKIIGLEGTAGSAKTTTVAFIREAAVREGYQVEGFAPTSRAAQQLEEAGIRSSTLQRYLAGGTGETTENGVSTWLTNQVWRAPRR